MDGWTLIPALVLVSISALGVARHWRNWREDRPGDSWYVDTTADMPSTDEVAAALQRPDFQQEERDFFRRQFRRRLQGSLMIGVLGLLLPVGSMIEDATWNLVYVTILLSLLGWMLLLGIADLVATRHHFNRVREQLLAEMLAGARAEPAADEQTPEKPGCHCYKAE